MIEKIRAGSGFPEALAGVWRYSRKGRVCEFTVDRGTLSFGCNGIAGVIGGNGSLTEDQIAVSAMPGMEMLRLTRRQ